MYKAKNPWTCCLIAMVVIGILLIIAGIILIIVGKVVYFSGYYSCYYYCYYVSSSDSSVLVGIGSGALALGCILFIIAIVLKNKRS